jgi:hypothetical protein
VAHWIGLEERMYDLATGTNGFLNRKLHFDPFFDMAKIRVDPVVAPIDLVTWRPLHDPPAFSFFWANRRCSVSTHRDDQF